MRKKYPRIQFIIKSFQADKIGALGMFLTKLVASISYGLEILLIAKLLDSLILTFTNSGTVDIGSFLAIILVWLMKSVSELLYKASKEHVSNSLSKSLSLEVLSKKQRIQYQELEKKENWDLMERVQADPSPKWIEGYQNLLDIWEDVLRAGWIFITIATAQWVIAILTLLFLLPYGILAVRNGQEEYTAYEESTRHFRIADYFRSILSNRENVEERILFHYQDWGKRKWENEYSQAVQIERKANRKIFGRMGSLDILSAVTTGSIAFILLWSLLNASMTSGLYISIIKGIFEFVDEMSVSLAPTVISFEKSKYYLRDYSAFQSLPDETEEGRGPFVCDQIETIEFKDVSFSYPSGSTPIIDHLHLTLYGNRKYALVGENGAGKTTLIKLLTGFYSQYEGEILINGREVRTIKREDLRRLFSVVYQNYAKYETTFSQNLLPNPTSDEKDEEIQKVLTSIGLRDILGQLPMGMHTPLGKLDPEGVDLSGGQWQLLAIARGLINDARIYVLDEPTASIDPIKEAEIYRIFKQALQNKFAFLITHRLGGARIADEIIVLKDGKVVEQGTHEELLRQSGKYHEMYQEQKSWYEK